MNHENRQTRHGFSLIEAITVVAIVGVLAAGVAPAIRSQTALQQGCAAAEVARVLRVARSNAMATGEPTGVQVSAADDSLALVVTPHPGSGVITLNDALGGPWPTIVIPDRFGGAEIAAVTGGNGESGTATLWFAHSGEPQVRSSSGTLVSTFEQDAVITLSGEHHVTVRAVSGVIE